MSESRCSSDFRCRPGEGRDDTEYVARTRATTAFAQQPYPALAVTIQVLLGVAAWWLLRPFDGLARPVTFYQALIRTGHQTNAALLLGASVVLTLRSFRHLSPTSSAAWSPSSTLPREALA